MRRSNNFLKIYTSYERVRKVALQKDFFTSFLLPYIQPCLSVTVRLYLYYARYIRIYLTNSAEKHLKNFIYYYCSYKDTPIFSKEFYFQYARIVLEMLLVFFNRYFLHYFCFVIAKLLVDGVKQLNIIFAFNDHF